MQRRRLTLVWTCLAATAITVAVPGCGRRLRGIETGDQTLLHGGRSVLQQAGEIEAVVSPVRVPWGSKSSPVGFLIELTNLSQVPIQLAVDQIELHDAWGRILQPLPPQMLLRSFGADSGEPTRARRVAYRPRTIHRHYRRRYPVRFHYRPRIYAYPYGHYGYWPSRWSGGTYYNYGYDPYAEQRHTARFLSELLTDQAIPPQHTVVGHVVFPYRLEKDDELTLVLHLHRQGRGTTSQPAPAPESDGSAGPLVTTLAFRFEVD